MAEAARSKSETSKKSDQVQRSSRGPAGEGASGDFYGGVLGLQRSAGNRAVSGLLESSFGATPTAGGVIQRKCKECLEEDLTLQRSSLGSDGGTHAGRAEAPSIVQSVIGSPGQPLDHATRAQFEPRFGRDFSDVRVHTGATASKSAREVNAEAYTVGSHLVFSEGSYAPESREGQKLLAHELTHVTQQSNGQASASTMTSSLEVGAADDPHEREAEQVAERVTAGHSASPQRNGMSALRMKPSPVVMREEKAPVEEYKKPGWEPVNQLGIVRVEEAEAKLRGARLRPEPSTAQEKYLHLKENTKVFVIAKNKESNWVYVNVPAIASFGYIAGHLIWIGLPDPKAQLFYVAEKGMGLQKLVESPEHYNLENAEYLKNYIKTGDDARSLVMAIYMANEQDSRTQGHVYINQEKLKEAQDPGTLESLKDAADEYRRVLRPILQSVEVQHGEKIWIPGEAFIRGLKDKNIIPTRPEWKNMAIAAAKAVGGFLAGLVDGFLSSIIEVFTGIYDLIKSIISLVSDLLTGEVIKQATEFYEAITQMSGDELLKMVKEAATTLLDEILKPFEKAWKSKNVFDKSYAWGKIVGYILAEVLMAIFTGGSATAVKWLGKLGKFGTKLLKILRKILDKVDDVLDKVPGRKNKKKTAHQEKTDKGDGSDKAKQLPLALTMAAGIAETNDAHDSSIPVVLAQLLPVKSKFKWIKKFDADRKSPGHYKILMYASPPHIVDDDYTPDDDDYKSDVQEEFEEAQQKGVPTDEPEGTQGKIISAETARVKVVHDLGNSKGKIQAVNDGFKPNNPATGKPWENPYEFDGPFGKGIDDIMFDKNGDPIILEYKGGTSELNGDQMRKSWVCRKIKQLKARNDPMAVTLETAMLSNKLKGRVYRTPVDDSGNAGTTFMDGRERSYKGKCPP